MLFATNSWALEDTLEKSLEIAAHGNKFQAERIKIAAENLANANSTSSLPGGNPYRRKIIIGHNIYDKKLNTRLVKVKKYANDKKPFKLKYDPYHPAADANGYIKLPNIDKHIENADAMEAQRNAEAALNIIEIPKSMQQKTLEVMK